ncbi:MAG: hypothetical protein JO368_07605, partial [Acidimicrobiales bacterium]|nr:hypothetical protein [Acidimicrobiales bacterium]
GASLGTWAAPAAGVREATEKVTGVLGPVVGEAAARPDWARKTSTAPTAPTATAAATSRTPVVHRPRRFDLSCE